MYRFAKTAITLFFLNASFALAEDCGDIPGTPDIPKGKKATLQQMIDTKQAIADYQENAKAFRTCLSGKIESLAASTKPNQEVAEEAKLQTAELLNMFNKSVDAEEALAADFNTSIRAFKKAEAKRKNQ